MSHALLENICRISCSARSPVFCRQKKNVVRTFEFAKANIPLDITTGVTFDLSSLRISDDTDAIFYAHILHSRILQLWNGNIK